MQSVQMLMRFIVQLVSATNSIELTDTITGVRFSLDCGQVGYFTHYTFSSDNQTFVSSTKNRVCFWNTATGKLIGEFNTNVHYPCFIWSIMFSPNDQFLVIASKEKQIFLVNAKTFSIVGNLTNYPIGRRYVYSYNIVWSHDSTQFAVSCTDKKVLVFNVGNNSVITIQTVEHFGTITSFAFTPNGNSLAVVFSKVPIIQIYSLLGSQTLQMQFEANATNWRTEKPFNSLAFSPTSSLIAAGSMNNRVYYCSFNPENFEMDEVTIIKARHVKEVSFSPDELKLIVKKFNGSYHIFILQLAKTLLLSMMLTGKEGRL